MTTDTSVLQLFLSNARVLPLHILPALPCHPRVSKVSWPQLGYTILPAPLQTHFAKPLVSKYHSTGREEEIL